MTETVWSWSQTKILEFSPHCSHVKKLTVTVYSMQTRQRTFRDKQRWVSMCKLNDAHLVPQNLSDLRFGRISWTNQLPTIVLGRFSGLRSNDISSTHVSRCMWPPEGQICNDRKEELKLKILLVLRFTWHGMSAANECRAAWTAFSAILDTEGLLVTAVALKAPRWNEVVFNPPESAMQDKRLSFWLDHNLWTNKTEYWSRYDLDPWMWTEIIGNP